MELSPFTLTNDELEAEYLFLKLSGKLPKIIKVVGTRVSRAGNVRKVRATAELDFGEWKRYVRKEWKHNLKVEAESAKALVLTSSLLAEADILFAEYDALKAKVINLQTQISAVERYLPAKSTVSREKFYAFLALELKIRN